MELRGDALFDEAEHGPHAVRRLRQLEDRRVLARQRQVDGARADAVAGQRQLGEQQQLDAGLAGLGDVVEMLVLVGRDVAQRGLDLRHRDLELGGLRHGSIPRCPCRRGPAGGR